MAVYLIFKYSKRFRFAPLFNKLEILPRRYDYQRITVNFGFEGLPIANNLDFGTSLQLSSGHSSCYYCSTKKGKKIAYENERIQDKIIY